MYAFVKKTSNISSYVENRLSFLEHIYGIGKDKYIWKMIGSINGSLYYKASYLFGCIIKRFYNMKNGDDYQDYSRKAFMFDKLDVTLTNDMTKAYVSEVKKEWRRRQKEREKGSLIIDANMTPRKVVIPRNDEMSELIKKDTLMKKTVSIEGRNKKTPHG